MISPSPHRWRIAAAFAVALVLAGSGMWAATASPAAAAPADDVLTWTGASGAATGSAVSQQSCDFTGDSRDDIVTSAWMWDRLGGDSSGVAYVIPSGAEPGQLDDPTTGVIRIEGPVTDSGLTGFSVGCAGDVNGDDIDDIVVTQFTESRVFVVFGSREPEHVLLDHLGDRGFIIASDEDDRTGFFATGVSDLNGDGKDDIGVISLTRNQRSGLATIVAGSADIATVTIPDSERVIATIEGTPAQGVSTLAPAGDVNGDGKPDLVLGGYVAAPEGYANSAHGMAWVVFGDVTGQVKLGEDFAGFTINGPERGRDRLGISVAAAGDIDNDGKDDVLLGADGVSNPQTGPRGGAAVLVRGSNSADTVRTDPEAVDGRAVYTGKEDRGWWIDGGAEAGNFGYAVSALAPQHSNHSGTLVVGDFAASRAWAIDSRALTAPVVSADAIAADHIVTLQGADAKERLGRGVGVIAGMNGRGGHQLVAGGDAIGGIGTVRVADLPPQGPRSPEPDPGPEPTDSPTDTPTQGPTDSPTGEPTDSPTGEPTDSPTGEPTDAPAPTEEPTQQPDDDGDIDDGGSDDDPTDNGGSRDGGEDDSRSPDDRDADGQRGDLPRTGAQIAGALAAGALLIGVGSAALALYRRRRK